MDQSLLAQSQVMSFVEVSDRVEYATIECHLMVEHVGGCQTRHVVFWRYPAFPGRERGHRCFSSTKASLILPDPQTNSLKLWVEIVATVDLG